MVVFAPRAREALLALFAALAARDADAADALRVRLDEALTRAEGDAGSGEVLVLPGGRVVHRLRIDSLALIYERTARGVRVLLIERA